MEGSLRHYPLREVWQATEKLLWHASRRGTLIWFIWSVLFICLLSCNQTNNTDQINKRDQPLLALHAPPSVLLRWAMMSLASAIGFVVKGEAC